MKKVLIVLMLLVTLLTTCMACGKKEKLDPNAVLTDSDVPLDVGAEMDYEMVDIIANEA